METKQAVRTVPARDTNGSIYWKKIVKERTVFTDEDRTEIVAEYQAGKMTAAEIVKKYRLSSKQVLFSWMDRYLREESLSLGASEANSMAKDPEERIRELELENRRLQKALNTETLRAKAFDTMIELAESKFNIPIRKKSGTKR
jgi:transposase-like protein